MGKRQLFSFGDPAWKREDLEKVGNDAIEKLMGGQSESKVKAAKRQVRD